MAENLNITIFNQDVCQRKTSNIVVDIAKSSKKCVYIIPAYDEISNFIKLWQNYGDPNKKVVVLKGKKRSCLRTGAQRMKCTGCPYKTNVIVDVNKKIVTPDDYDKECPYYNLLGVAEDADVIVSHLENLWQLYKQDRLPYEPEKVKTYIDEGEVVLRGLMPKPFPVISFETERTYFWVNVNGTSYINLFTQIIDRMQQQRELRDLWLYYKNIFDPKKYGVDLITNLLKEIDTIKGELNERLYLLPFDEIDFTVSNMDINEETKKLFLDWLWCIFGLRDIQLIARKDKTGAQDLWLIPYPLLTTRKLPFLRDHRDLVLSSASITDKALNILHLSVGRNTTIELKDLPEIKHSNVLVIVSPYSLKHLVYQLYKENYLTYITHSSFREAEEFAAKMLKVDIATPHTLRELDKFLNDGKRVINLVQSSPKLSMNLRLDGDVVVVGTYISKHVEKYYDREELLEHCVIGETMQALGRIVNDHRNVVIILPPEVWRILEANDKFKTFEVKQIPFKGGETASKFTDKIMKLVKEHVTDPIGISLSKPKKPKLKLYVTGTKRGKRIKVLYSGYVNEDIIDKLPKTMKIDL